MKYEKYYSIIRQYYFEHNDNLLNIFKTVIDVGNIIGIDHAFKFLESCVLEKRMYWLKKNFLSGLLKFVNSIDNAYEIFYEKYLNIKIGRDGEFHIKSEKMIVTRWWNNCPILNVCNELNLDTRYICKRVYDFPSKRFIQEIDPKLEFFRNYNSIRPYENYCEETIIYKL